MKRGIWLAAVIVLPFLMGCAQKFTHERFSMIHTGVDDRVDVRKMIGEPRFDAGDQWYFEDLDRHCSALVYFGENGRVSGKEWLDGATGSWEGHNPNAAAAREGEPRERSVKTRTIDGN